jgi:glycosyltransferase involved in cell wall biosynthesis
MALFSIITVTLNDLPNLIQTARSVAAQDFPDKEYIICDGASTDGTVARLPELGADKYISQPDRGIFDAMNKGLSLCSGDFICFLNAGDTFHASEVLRRVAAAIHRHPDIGLFYGDVYYQNSIRPFSVQPDRLTPFLLFRGTVCHQAWFVKAEVYRTLGGFDPHLRFKGDHDALCRMFHVHRVPYKHLPICVANYLGGGFSERHQVKSRPEFEAVRSKYLTPRQARFYGLLLRVLDLVRENPYYQQVMAVISRGRARRSWVENQSKGR